MMRLELGLDHCWLLLTVGLASYILGVCVSYFSECFLGLPGEQLTGRLGFISLLCRLEGRIIKLCGLLVCLFVSQ